jgi:hypothetical protein
MEMEKVIQIVKDEIGGLPPSIFGKEADMIRSITRRDMAICERNGWVLDLSHELPDLGDLSEDGKDQALIKERQRLK